MLQFNPDSVVKKIDMDFTKRGSQSLAALDLNLEEETGLSSTVEYDGGEVNELDNSIGIINDGQKLDEIFHTNPRLEILSQNTQSKPPGRLTVSYNQHSPTEGITSHAENVLDPDPALVDSILRIISAPMKSQGIHSACVSSYRCPHNVLIRSRNKIMKRDTMLVLWYAVAQDKGSNDRTTFEAYIPKSITEGPQNFMCRNGMMTWEKIVECITRNEKVFTPMTQVLTASKIPRQAEMTVYEKI